MFDIVKVKVKRKCDNLKWKADSWNPWAHRHNVPRQFFKKFFLQAFLTRKIHEVLPIFAIFKVFTLKWNCEAHFMQPSIKICLQADLSKIKVKVKVLTVGSFYLMWCMPRQFSTFRASGEKYWKCKCFKRSEIWVVREKSNILKRKCFKYSEISKWKKLKASTYWKWKTKVRVKSKSKKWKWKIKYLF